MPTIVTPVATISSPGRSARSCRRSPRRGRRSPSRRASRSTAVAVISRGAGRPGTRAVVITTSKLGIRACSARLLRGLLLGRQLARVAALGLLAATPRSRNVAPSDSTCSLTAGRTSKADTTAPSRRAVAIACSPATPAPSTSTFAGGDRAGGGHQHREEPRHAVGRDQHGLVAGDRRLRGERVHRLRARDPRDRLHRERDARPAAAAARCPSWSVSGCEKADEHRPARAAAATSSGAGAATCDDDVAPSRASVRR